MRLTSLHYGTFFGCTSLSQISIPGNTTSLGSYIFYGCPALEAIKYEGSESQWNSMNKSDDWNTGLTDTKIEFSNSGSDAKS